MRKRYFLLLSVLAVLALAFSVAPSYVGQVPSGAEGISYHSKVVVHINNELWDETENIVTNLGKETIMGAAFFAANQSEVSYIGVGGNDTYIAATDTALDWEYTGQGLTRALASKGWSGAGTLNVSMWYQFTATADNLNVNATGLYNTSVGHAKANASAYFAGASFTNALLQTSDTLNITWFTWIA